MLLQAAWLIMTVDGEHSQPITAHISNHQGQRSSHVHQLSPFDVPVICPHLIIEDRKTHTTPREGESEGEKERDVNTLT